MAWMRVALVNRLAGIHRGGGEVYDLCLAAALRAAGVEVEIVTGRPFLSPPPAPVEEGPARYARTPYLRGWAHRFGRAGWRLLDFDLRLFERSALDQLRAMNPAPELVHVTGLPRLAHAIETRLRLPALLLFPGPPALGHAATIAACANVAGVGAVTPYLRRHFRGDVHDMTAGVDPVLFRPAASDLRARLGIPETAPVVLFAGRLVPLKNLPLLVEAFAHIRSALPDARLLVVGDGPMRRDLTARVARAGLRGSGADPVVILAGEARHAEMPGYYAAADLLVLTSMNESFSLVALEAMACGRAVLVPAVGYLPKLVEDGVTGALYPAGDRRALVGRAAELLRDPALRASLGASARESALTRHSWPAVARSFIDLYHRILSA